MSAQKPSANAYNAFGDGPFFAQFPLDGVAELT